MKAIVMGGGVIGVTTAYYLAKSGHEVTVIERNAGPAEEASYGNAGIVAPGHAYSWASPRAPLILLQSLWRDDTALRFRFRLEPRLWLWSLRFLANCTAARNRANTLTKLRICIYSRDALRELREETGIAYDETTRGTLYLYRDAAHLETAIANMRLLQDNGLVGLEGIDARRSAEIEPALAPVKDKFAGAIHCSFDESGDSNRLCRELVRLMDGMGVTFRWNTTVRGLRAEGDRIAAVVTDNGEITGDAYVMSLASETPRVLKGLGYRMPIYPIKGYSLTVSSAGYEGAPSAPVIDEHYLMAFTPIGDRFRATATAEFAGYDTSFTPEDFAPMLKVVRDVFPEGGDYDNPSYFACLRPMTPDGPPVIGRSRHRNLWFNTGHGHIGWTMACGSSRAAADLVSGRAPDIDLSGMEPGRF
ncbi:MAG: D-amino acid dehydrogenase [Alphaproteobacteria bacterium]